MITLRPDELMALNVGSCVGIECVLDLVSLRVEVLFYYCLLNDWLGQLWKLLTPVWSSVQQRLSWVSTWFSVLNKNLIYIAVAMYFENK
jgi:hypothetical protein